MFKKEWERATTPKALDLKPPYADKVAAKEFSHITKRQSFRSLMAIK